MHRVRWALGGIVLWVASGCAFQEDPSAGQLDDLELAPIAQALYADTSLYWPGSPPVIPVCWEPGTPNATARGWVRDAIESQWVRFGRVNFVGWDFCATATQPGVHIRDWESARARGEIAANAAAGNANAYGNTPGGRSGRFLDGVYGGVTVSFCPNLTGTARENCVRELALHEFGHVLGFYHEEEHPDYAGGSGACAKQQFAASSPQRYGAPDSTRSVMSYCATAAGDVIRLGPNDIAGLQRAYGRRIPGQLVSPRGNCLALATFNPGNPGAKPFLWDCDEVQDDQEWERNATARSFRIDTTGTGTGVKGCLHDATTSGVEVRDCNSSFAQAWDLADVEVRGWGGKCLDLRDGNTTDGTRVQLWDCFSDRTPSSYNANQRWNVVRVNVSSSPIEIRYAANTNKCVTVSGGNAVDGASLVLSTCNGGTAQRFRFGNNGSLYFSVGTTTKCLDAQGVSDSQYLSGSGGPYDGALIHLFGCGSSSTPLNQKWNLSGPIRQSLGGCLAHPSDANGGYPTVATCATPSSSMSTQVWDYYFK